MDICINCGIINLLFYERNTLFMNDNELEEILNEIKNNKSPKKDLDSNEFEDILNSLHIDVDATDEESSQNEVPKEEVKIKKTEPVAEKVVDNDSEFNITEEIVDDEKDFTPANQIVTDNTVEDNYFENDEDLSDSSDEPSQSEENDDDNVYFSDMEDMTDIAGGDKKPKKKGKAVAIILIVVVLIAAICVGAYFYFFANKDTEEPKTTKEKVTETITEKSELGPLNPLTGETGYDENALTQRPVAVVVENEYSTSSVRPQWGLADADIVLEGESEFSTRMLLFWADYNKVPEQVGPARSARPPFIHFSQLFDAVFIHAGLSHSKDNYVGADEVFESENIDHINLLSFSESSSYFHRDKSRTSTIEHTGCLMGANTADMLKNSKIDLKLNESKFTKLQFNEEAKALSTDAAKEVSFKWSKGYCPKVGKYTYDSEKHKYTTTDFDSKYGTSGVEWENLIFLLDETEYIVKHNYKHAGNSETYCNYKLSGGKGIVCSEGTCVEITWGVKNGKLWMKDAQGNEVTLNPGKSYIGYGSSNHGGYYEVSGAATADASTTDEQ